MLVTELPSAPTRGPRVLDRRAQRLGLSGWGLAEPAPT